MDDSEQNGIQMSSARQPIIIHQLKQREKLQTSNAEHRYSRDAAKQNNNQAFPTGQEDKVGTLTDRVMISNVVDAIAAKSNGDNGEGLMINSQVYGFSMRRKRNNPPSTNIQPGGTAIRSFTQQNDLQSSRCQSNISLDSLLTQYKHKPRNNNNPTLPKKVFTMISN